MGGVSAACKGIFGLRVGWSVMECRLAGGGEGRVGIQLYHVEGERRVGAGGLIEGLGLRLSKGWGVGGRVQLWFVVGMKEGC